jgi:hypothetical protein
MEDKDTTIQRLTRHAGYGLRSARQIAKLPGMETDFTYRHRVVSKADVDFIRQLIAQHPGASRRRLSEKLCEAWHWVQANGRLRDMVCRGLMLALHRAGRIDLPPVRRVMPNPLAQRCKPALVPDEDCRPGSECSGAALPPTNRGSSCCSWVGIRPRHKRRRPGDDSP